MTGSGSTTAELATIVPREPVDLPAGFADGEAPDFLLAARRAAWRRYHELPMPTRKSEEWRYTDLSDLNPEAFTPVTPVDAGNGRAAADGSGIATTDEAAGEAGGTLPADLPDPVRAVLTNDQARSAVMVQINATITHRLLDEEVAAAGVIHAPIAEAARTHPDLLRERVFASDVPDAEAKLWALHVALLSNGYLLYVPRGVSIPEPVHTLRWVDREGALVASHSLVIAEPGAEVTCVDEFLSPDLASPSLSVAGAEIFGGDGASVSYLSLQRYGRGIKHFAMQHAMARREARLSGVHITLGADLARADVSSHLLGAGSESEMLALWFGQGEQHFDHHTLQHHVAPHARSDLLYKGALTGAADSVFRGLIRVGKGAQLTDAYQTNRNLLLSEESNATTLPNLEIEADDVRCSHGATVGQVDEMQLFYLMSRGLTREQAERLLVFGFFDEVLGRVPVEGVRTRIRHAIEEKIGIGS